MNRHTWKTGRIVSKIDKNNVCIEFCSNKTHSKDKLFKLTQIIRSPRNISIISSVDDVDLNSRSYFDKVNK